MTLKDQIAEMEKEALKEVADVKEAEVKEEEVKTETEEEEDVREEEKAEEAEEVDDLEGSKEDVKDEDVEPEDDKKRKTGFAKLRKENKEKDAELADLRARMDALARQVQARPVEKKEDSDPEPDKEEDRETWLEWDGRRKDREIKELRDQFTGIERDVVYTNARRELDSYENRYRKEIDDYDDALNYLTEKAVKRLREMNPHASEDAIRSHLDNDKLMHAANFKTRGLNPAEAFYEAAVNEGYRPEGEEDVDKAKKKIKSLGKYKDRTVPSEGNSEMRRVGLSTEEALDMPIKDFYKRATTTKDIERLIDRELKTQRR